MSNSKKLRENKNQHISKSLKSTQHEGKVRKAVENIFEKINKKLKGTDYIVVYKKRIYLKELTDKFNIMYSDGIKKEIIRDDKLLKTFISPDGGFLFLKNIKTGREYMILSSEAKRQGTNNERIKEKKTIQAKGNAIERLGKNLIFIRNYMFDENITPFVCFGYG